MNQPDHGIAGRPVAQAVPGNGKVYRVTCRVPRLCQP